MNKLNEWFRRADEANLFTERERENIKEAIATLNLVPLTQCAIEDLCDAIYKLGQFANIPAIKPAPEELLDKTKKWLDTQTAEERLSTIKDICVDWDGYRTAEGLGSLINEIWAYAAYPCNNKAHVMTLEEAKQNINGTIWMEHIVGHKLILLTERVRVTLSLTGVLDNWDGYNKYWRCWNKKPTTEQMKEVPWDDD